MHQASHGIRRTLLALAGVVAVLPPAFSQERQQCRSIEAADGSCVDPNLVETANRRAAIVSSQFTSYLGTPLGSVGMPFIPQERLFRDDPTLFGLPTTRTTTVSDGAETTTRSK